MSCISCYPQLTYPQIVKTTFFYKTKKRIKPLYKFARKKVHFAAELKALAETRVLCLLLYSFCQFPAQDRHAPGEDVNYFVSTGDPCPLPLSLLLTSGS